MPAALFMVFQLDSKGAEVHIFIISFSTSVLFFKRRISVKLVDLVESFQTFMYYLLAKFGVDTAEKDSPVYQPASRERASQSLPKISKQLE